MARLAFVLCLPPGVDDTVTVLLQYPGGVHASFTCSISVELCNTASVSGTKGTAQVSSHRPSWDWPRCWEPWPLAGGVGKLWLWSWRWAEAAFSHTVAKECILKHQSMGWGLDQWAPS